MKAKLKMMLAMFIFGSTGLYFRHMEIPSSVLSLFRGIIGVLFILIVMAFSRKKVSIASLKKNWYLLVLSAIGLGVNWILLFEAYRHTTIAVATVSYYLAPIFVVILSPFVLKEKLTATRVICILTSLLGMLFVSQVFGGASGSNMWLGIGLAVIAALFYAGVVIVNKFLRDISGIDTTVAQLALVVLLLTPYTLITEDYSSISFNTTTIILVLIVGVVNTGFSYLLYFGSMKDLNSQSVAVYSYIDPVTAVLLSALVLREPISGMQIVGVLLILGSTLVSELYGAKGIKRHKPKVNVESEVSTLVEELENTEELVNKI